MAIVYAKKKIRGRNWMLEWLFPKMIRETRCKECGRPFLEHPEREPKHRFEEGRNMATKKEPTHEIRFGSVRATIWHYDSSSGERWFSVITSRPNKDKRDLAKAIAAANLWVEQHADDQPNRVIVTKVVGSDTEKSPKGKRRPA